MTSDPKASRTALVVLLRAKRGGMSASEKAKRKNAKYNPTAYCHVFHSFQNELLKLLRRKKNRERIFEREQGDHLLDLVRIKNALVHLRIERLRMHTDCLCNTGLRHTALYDQPCELIRLNQLNHLLVTPEVTSII